MSFSTDAISSTAAGRDFLRARARDRRSPRAVDARVWARLARLAPRWVRALALGAGACATAPPPHAADSGPSSLALHPTLSFSTLSEDAVDEAELVLAGADLDFALGLRQSEGVRLAYEATLGFRSVVSVTHRYDVSFNRVPLEPIEGQVGFLLPLGFCLELLPDASEGMYGSAHFGGGVFRAWDLMPESEFHFAARIALDLGWQLPLDDESSLGVSARYSLLGLKRVYLDEAYSNALVSHEVSAGVQWNF